jgi:hypothetical protein
MSDRYTFREFRDSDLDAALRLWERDSGWGAITEQQWREWFLDTPAGRAPLTVALNHRGELVGQMVGVPSRILLDGFERRAFRLSAPIVQSSLRGVSALRSDFLGFFKTHLQIARNQGFSIAYAQPRRGFLPFLRWSRSVGLPSFAEAKFGCCEYPISKSARFSANDAIEVCVGTEFGSDYDELWETAIAKHSIHCGVARNSQYVRYKLGSHHVLEVRRKSDKGLLGYVAVRLDDGLMVDMVTRSPDLTADVIVATIRFLAAGVGDSNNNGLERLKVMCTQTLRASLEQCGFQPAKFTFAFVCCSIDDAVAQDSITPNRWYLMPGD